MTDRGLRENLGTDDVSRWVCDANEAITLFLGTNGFKPEMTYAVVGQEEKIVGYRDLKVNLCYTPGSLMPYFEMSYASQIPRKLGYPRPMDVYKMMREKHFVDFLPNRAAFEAQCAKDARRFRPPGVKVHEYRAPAPQPRAVDATLVPTTGTRLDAKTVLDPAASTAAAPSAAAAAPEATSTPMATYEIYECAYDTPGWVEYSRRLQLFLLWYIEGATFVDEDDAQWRFLLLFEKRPLAAPTAADPVAEDADEDDETAERGPRGERYEYICAGYVTCYEFFAWPDLTRPRISQFLIMPPYQAQGHGGRFYDHLVALFRADRRVCDFTVEEPNESFHVMRLRHDARCLAPLLRERQLGPEVLSPTHPEFVRLLKETKINAKQLTHALEMTLRAVLPRHDAAVQTAYRRAVKARIYKRDKSETTTLAAAVASGAVAAQPETLANLDPEHLKKNLGEAFDRLMAEYDQILEGTFEIVRQHDDEDDEEEEEEAADSKKGDKDATRPAA